MNTTLTIRIDEQVKRDADVLFGQMGLTLSAAINLFVRQALREQAIPFQVRLAPNRRTLQAMAEAQRVAEDEQSPSYPNAKALFEALDALDEG